MSQNAIEIKGLSYSFGRVPILNNLNLTVPKGTIFGFLGQNGAGKTTSLRLLTGLLVAPNNTIFINGKELNGHRTELMNCMGSLIGTPSAYPKLSAKQHISYWCKLYAKSLAEGEELLKQVSLWEDRNKKVKNFSTGMVQRLNIAYVLLRNPDIILLDEPFNGLDPEGVYLLKNILTKWHDEKKTILCSSHILSEMEQFCSHIAILDRGKVRYQGSLDELLLDQTRLLEITTHQVDLAIEVLNESGFTPFAKQSNLSIPFNDTDELNKILHILITNGVVLEGIYEYKTSLENRYINILNEQTI